MLLGRNSGVFMLDKKATFFDDLDAVADAFDTASDGLRTVAGTGQPTHRGQIHQDERQGVPHLAVRVSDRTGLVGLLVIPGE